MNAADWFNRSSFHDHPPKAAEPKPPKVGDKHRCHDCEGTGWSRSASGRCTACRGARVLAVREVCDDGRLVMGRVDS